MFETELSQETLQELKDAATRALRDLVEAGADGALSAGSAHFTVVGREVWAEDVVEDGSPDPELWARGRSEPAARFLAAFHPRRALELIAALEHARGLRMPTDPGSAPAPQQPAEPLFACRNCSWTGTKPVPAKDPWARHEPGDVFSDRECPACGALVDEEEANSHASL
jgi:hypothetical protein